MSTRLLDWTESLLVAAYFASEQMNTGPGLIYALPAPLGLSAIEVQNPFKIERVGLYKPPHISVRIPAQQSVFTLHPDPVQPYRPDELCEWRITPNAAGEIKEVLNSCGMNLRSLFPDVDGLARYMAWRYKWGL